MNQGRIWCVVNPTVGLPLFLGSVALMSFTVHFAVLNNTTWMKDLYNGIPMKHAAVETAVNPVAEITPSAKPAKVLDVAQATVVPAFGSTALAVKIKPKTPLPELALPVPG
jgi:light-harvesting protein B-800-850 alpha chain